MEVQIHSDIAGSQLLIDFYSVEEELAQDVSKSIEIFGKLFKLNQEKLIACSVDDYDDKFCLYVCSENMLCLVCGFKERAFITVDIRLLSINDVKEIEDWLIHEYHPIQITKSLIERGESGTFIPRDTKKVRKPKE